MHFKAGTLLQRPVRAARQALEGKVNTGARLARAHVPQGHQADAAGDGRRCGQLFTLARQLCVQLRELCKGHWLRARLLHHAAVKRCP